MRLRQWTGDFVITDEIKRVSRPKMSSASQSTVMTPPGSRPVDNDEKEHLVPNDEHHHCRISNELLNVDVDLVNSPNPWLPAYGFQIQHQHSYLHSANEDMHKNDPGAITSNDFLETILEETSEDLQSDSERSDGTTYWLGSDSETESVIHIAASQRAPELDECESERNSVIPKKRRRRNRDTSDSFCYCKDSDNNRWASSRSSSRSSTSSRSSSLVQFENLERTCGNVSPSGYSYDSLECSNRSNCYLENTSPDSLEDFEHDNILGRSKRSNSSLNKPNLGVFPKLRPYRSFESLDKCRDNVIFEDTRPLARSLWRESYDDQEGYYDGNSDEENHLSHQSLDWRNTVDLREIGLETNREAVLLDLARSQIASSADQLYARLNIDNTNNTALRIASGEQQRGWSNAPSPEFNFRFANKSRSVPSLPSGLEALSSCSSAHDIYDYRTSSATLAGRILSERFENFTRVASLPVGLNLFATCDDTQQHKTMSQNYHEMADDMAEMAYYHLDGISNSSEDEKLAPMAVESVHSDGSMENDGQPMKINKPTTVKTQDHGLDVVALSNNLDAVVDEAIRQFRSQVEEATSSGQSSELMKQHCSRPRRVKNNASYELAQQWEIDDQNFKLTSSAGDCPRPSACEKKRVVNNASYELAQQSDYIKALQLTSRPFQRMDACEELLESPINTSPGMNDRLEVDTLPVASHDKKPENLLSQIKKNSVVFSTLGDAGNCTGASMPEDEVDFPCLETKIISSYELLDGQLPAIINNFRVNDYRKNINMELIDDLLIDNLNELSSGNKMALETSICADGERLSNITESQQTVEAIEGEIGGDEQLQSTVLLEHCSEKEEVGRNSQSHSTQLASSSSSGSVNTPVLSAQSADGLEDVAALKEKNTEIVVDQRIIREQHTSLPRVSTMATRSSSLGKADFLGRKSPILSIRSESQDEKKKSGLGGFFQRFSRLRFSGRSKGIDIKKRNMKKPEIVDAEALRKQTEQPTRITEPNYIIIPLHPPEEEKIHNDSIYNDDFEASASHMGANGRSPVCSSKPPLPPCQGTRACAPSPRMSTLAEVGARRRAVTDLGNPADIEMAKARVMQHHHRQVDGQYNERPAGLLETDLDADILAVSDEVTGNSDGASKKTRSLLNLNHSSRQGRENVLLRVPQSPGGPGCRSTGDHPDHVSNSGNIHQRPHKSMEFLLDKENLHFIKPPENELQKVMGAAPERVPSEHELRVQRSLQRLNVPDWYKNSPAARDGFRLKRHSDASQHGGWRSLGSKTTSLSSLSSSSNLRQPTAGPLSSPTPPPVFSRWSTSLLNSTGSSPANSVHSSFNHRQPYLGWRSQERLANPRTPAERLAQGILPQLEAKKQAHQQLDVRNSIKEVTSAIVHYVQSGQEASKNGRLSPNDDHDNDDMCGDNDISMRSIGSRGEGIKLCWMESSFVGSRPVDSPETPMSLATDTECCCTGCNATTGVKSCVNSSASGLYLDLAPSDMSSCPSPSSTCHHRQQRYQRGAAEEPSEGKQAMSVTTAAAILRSKPSPGSTTLEDVLDSLLGLPSGSSRTPSPGPKGGKSCSDLRQDLQEYAKSTTDCPDRPPLYLAEHKERRKSEGSDTITSQCRLPLSSRNRRVSFDTTNAPADKVMVRCRNGKCINMTTLAEARRYYKSCHNCTCMYCSRECRRAHWQRHRRTCRHSRVGALCRQVLSAAKDDPATLRHISLLARQGYVSHGHGAVKCFFSSPEMAEQFVSHGFKDLGEPIYVRSSDLQLSEMGTELYAEIMRLCKSYNPETRLVLYVAICVVSEVPSDQGGPVKWERQLISRCGKIRLDLKIQQSTQQQTSQKPSVADGSCNITREMESPETLVLTSLPRFNNIGNEEKTPKRVREIGFTNIQRQLRLRGVSLRRHFPQVYNKLCSYVEGSVDKFAPVTIYPRDQASGKSFMCIIMLDAEPEKLRLLPTDSSRVKTVDISVIE